MQMYLPEYFKLNHEFAQEESIYCVLEIGLHAKTIRSCESYCLIHLKSKLYFAVLHYKTLWYELDA